MTVIFLLSYVHFYESALAVSQVADLSACRLVNSPKHFIKNFAVNNSYKLDLQ